MVLAARENWKVMSASASEGVALLIRGPVATLTFDQKRTHNSMRLRSWIAVPRLIAEAEGEPAVRLIALRGAHGNFGSGNDLVEFRALHGRREAAEAFARAMAGAMRAVEGASKPVVVAIEGVCYGASVALALAGDMRIAANNATFAITPAKLGALYLQSDLYRLVATIGSSQAKKLIYSSQPITAAQAQAIGLVDEVIPAEGFEAALTLLMDAILRGSNSTLRTTKAMLRLVGHAATPTETEESLAVFIDATQGDDFVEGVDAFLQKRAARFR